MNQILAIAAGGSIGALTRFWVANGIYDWLGRGFPHGTLFVNVSGSFLMGFLTELMLQRFVLTPEYRAAILVGFLGAYTTFSTFAIETLYLFEEGSALKALLNLFLSTVLCLTAVWFGLILGRRLFADGLLPWLEDGLPWGFIFLGFTLALASGLGVEIALRRLSWAQQWQTPAVVVLLGGVATLSTLGLVLRLPEFGAGQGPGLFALNALGAAAAVWIGMLLGRLI
ncbi:MAG: fluoride efflux transporter CrcB [Methylococcaceae bacterium]|nr:fluoride efflux transporter CrcB [Methylococcaceae bacterium]